MAKQELCIAAMILFATAVKAEEPGYGMVVYPESPVGVPLSNRDINRFVCQGGGMEDVKFSAEKGIQGEGSGSDFYVKFQMIELEGKRSYVTARSEFYIKCAGKTYTIFGEPKNIRAQTVFLGGGGPDKVATNVAVFNPLSDEERVISITHAIMKEKVPATFSRIVSDEPYRSGIIPGADIRRRTHYRIEGTGLSAAEYLIRAARPMRLNEMQFLSRSFGRSIYGITLQSHELSAGDVGRVVIVYRGAAQ